MTRVICHNHVERGLDVTVTVSSLTNDKENMARVICHNYVERGLDVTVTVSSCEVSFKPTTRRTWLLHVFTETMPGNAENPSNSKMSSRVAG